MPRQKDENEQKKNTKEKDEKTAAPDKKPGAQKAAEKDFAPKETKDVLDDLSVLRYVVMTEKAIQMIETQNKLVFIVDRRKGKSEIKRAVEKAFESRVKEINTMIDQEGRKKAFIKFREPGQAGEIAIRLGII